MATCKLCWAVASALSLILMALSAGFMAVSTAEPSSDGRAAIVVSPAERDLVLKEMRALLEAVQTIIVANNAGDLNSVAIAARHVGRENMDPRSAEFAAKLPLAFRKLGLDTHTRFDELALDAEQIESTEYVFQKLGELTGNCVACHRAYRLETRETE